MSVSVEVLAAYLQDTEDARGVVAYIRSTWPRSLATYLSGVKREWMTLENHHPEYPEDSESASAKTSALLREEPKATRAALTAAVGRMTDFFDMPLGKQNKAQKLARGLRFSGDPRIDALIAGVRIFPDFMRELRVSNEERADMKDRARLALEKKSCTTWDVNAGELLDWARRVVADDISPPFELAAALALLTGRRMVEIFKLGSFDAAPAGYGDYACAFMGQAKTNELEAPQHYLLPLLAPLSDVQTGLSRLRRMKPAAELSRKEVNSKWDGCCCTAAKKVLGEDHKFHDMREAYAIITYNLALPHTWSLNYWVSKVLGHKGMENSLHYTCIHVKGLRDADRRPWPDASQPPQAAFVAAPVPAAATRATKPAGKTAKSAKSAAKSTA
ncbi:hypothetical protein JKP88DRAFT_273014 [Tribonema minus]|uniref:Telomere resolvase ResT/TelK catalytic domain-containing protein n=1 Tax=Tribonema minus TaxID=303371 RepID=A0A835YYB8_9STRA|nr:hypothetical protein JKP88DRAFT_273014 [Tribonema minus]